VQRLIEILQVAVVREHPVAAPELAHEGVAILQCHLALRGLADMRDDVLALDRVAANQLGHGRLAGALVIHEVAHAAPLEKGDAPAVAVVIGAPAALGKAGETEGHIGGRVAVHAEQLAHGGRASVVPVTSRGCRLDRWH
jgi:hypothetical protein